MRQLKVCQGWGAEFKSGIFHKTYTNLNIWPPGLPPGFGTIVATRPHFQFGNVNTMYKTCDS